METIHELPCSHMAFNELFAARPKWCQVPGISYTETCLRLAGPNGVRFQSA